MGPRLLLGLIFCSTLSAADLTLSNGRVLKDFQVVSENLDNVIIRHSTGTSSVSLRLLPRDWRQRSAPAKATPAAPVALATPTPSPSLKPASEPVRREEVPAKIDWRPLPPAPLEPSGIETILSGQCFVATKEGVNFKFGNVRVSVYPQDAFNAYRRTLNDQSRPVIAKWIAAAELASQQKDFSREIELRTRIVSAFDELNSQYPAPPFSTKTDADVGMF